MLLVEFSFDYILALIAIFFLRYIYGVRGWEGEKGRGRGEIRSRLLHHDIFSDEDIVFLGLMYGWISTGT